MKEIKGVRKVYKISQNDCYWNMICALEDGRSYKLNEDDIQNNRGIYIFWDWNDEPLRIGKAVKVRNRLISYYSQPVNNWYVFKNMQKDIAFVSVIYTKNERESNNIELDLLKKYKPKYNNHNKK